jgi:Ni/Co efflux regulator RcnB
MRKALIGMIMAATVLTPIAAQAQDGRRGHPRAEQRVSPEDRAARAEQRAERRQARQARQESPQPQAQAQAQVQQPQPSPQVVQRRGGGDGARRGDGVRRGDWNRGGRTSQPSVYPQAWQGDPNSPDLRRYQRIEQRNQQQGSYRRGDRTGDRFTRGDRRGDWDRSWRNDRRYDWRSWRNINRNIFRGSRYFSPYRNWGYSRFSIGLFLQPLFYGRNYWISDPWQYRLPHAYPGTQWVRYYNDVILVDVYSGEVIDVIYDFFW